MNIQDAYQTITNDFARKAADFQDSATFAYVTSLLAHIKAEGKDPADYEVIIARDEIPQYIEADGRKLKVDWRIRLERRKDVANLPVLGELDNIFQRSTPEVAEVYKQEVKDLMLELIGDDEPFLGYDSTGSEYTDNEAYGRNKLREKLREGLGNL